MIVFSFKKRMQDESKEFQSAMEARIKKNEARITKLKKIVNSLEVTVKSGRKRFGILDFIYFFILILLMIYVFYKLGLFDKLKVSDFKFL